MLELCDDILFGIKTYKHSKMVNDSECAKRVLKLKKIIKITSMYDINYQ